MSSVFQSQTIFGFDRETYQGRFAIDPTISTVIDCGTVGTGAGIARVLLLLKALIRVIGQFVMRRPDATYCFSVDTGAGGLLGRIFGVPCIYEVSDLHFTSNGKGLRNWVLVHCENWVLRAAHTVVVTSPYFLDELSGRVPDVRSKSVVIENGLPSELIARFNRQKATRSSDHRIRLGLVGAVKYWDLTRAFLVACSRYGSRLQCDVYGDGHFGDEVAVLCASNENLTFHGPFRNPDDLERIYRSVDLVVALYDPRDENVRVALPNKLYEAVYFGVPLLVSTGTALAQRVQEWGVGFDLNPLDPLELSSFLETISHESLVVPAVRCLEIGESRLQSDPEQLICRVRQLIRLSKTSESVPY